MIKNRSVPRNYAIGKRILCVLL